MKYLITESQLDKAIFRYLDNQDFIKVEYGINIYFVNSENDEYAQIRYDEISRWCTIERDLMKEISSFFSLDNNDSISVIAKWVESKLGLPYRTVDVANRIVIYYF
jgi:hypothetical protein